MAVRPLASLACVLLLVCACSRVVDGHAVGLNGSSLPSGTSGTKLTMKWREQLDGSGQDPNRIVGGVADAQRLYVSDEKGQVWALDANTGKTLWTRQVGRRTGRAVVEAGGVLWFYDTDTGLFVLDPATGRTLWTVAEGFVAPNVFAPPISGTLSLLDRDALTAVDVRTGKPRWTRDNVVSETPEVFFSRDQGASDGSRFYTLAVGNDVELFTVYALAPTTGKTLWTRALPRDSGPLLSTVPGLLLVGIAPNLDQGTIYAYDAATGAPKWQAVIPEPYDTHPSLRIGTQLLVPSTGRTFSVVDLTTGKVSTWGKGNGGETVGNCLGNPCTGDSDGVRVYDKAGSEQLHLEVPKESEIADLVTGPAGEVYLVGGTFVYRYG